MGPNNEAVRGHMDALFGDRRAHLIPKNLEGAQPEEREALIIKELSGALEALNTCEQEESSRILSRKLNEDFSAVLD